MHQNTPKNSGLLSNNTDEFLSEKAYQ